MKPALYLRVYVGFHGNDLLFGQIFNIIDPVQKRLGLDGRQLFELLLGNGRKDGPYLLKRDIQYLYQLRIHGICSHYQLGFQGPRGGVIPGMYDCTVGLGCIPAHIFIFIHYHYLNLVF